MKRGLVLVALSLVVIFSVALVSASFFSDFFNKITGKPTDNQTCLDSDGSDLTTRGEVSFVYEDGSPVTFYYPGNGTTVEAVYPDACMSQTTVAETRCVNNALTTNIYNCDSGSTCSNGACAINSSTNYTCADTDGGIYSDTRGTTYGRNGSVNHIQTDSCYSTSGLYEFYCTNEASPQIAYVAVNCSSGYSCANGACAISNNTNSTGNNQSCTDSDGGQVAGVRGTTIGYNASGLRTQTDSCYSTTGIYEFYCSNSTQIAVTSLNCSSGYLCVNGACNVTNTTGTPRGGDTSGSTSSGGGGSGGAGTANPGVSQASGATNGGSVVVSSGPGTPIQTSFTINKEESKVIGSDGSVAVSSVQVFVSEGRAFATKEDGSQQEIKIDPTEAINSVKESAKTENVGEVKMIEDGDKIVYEVAATKIVKVIALIPANMEITAKIDVEDGSVVSIQKPWWNFLAKEN